MQELTLNKIKHKRLIIFSYINVLLFLFPYNIIGNNINYDSIELYHISIFIIIFTFAFIEEFTFRYFIPKLLGSALSNLTVFSILFSLIHYLNGGFTLFAFVNTFLISMFLYLIRFTIGFFHCVIFHTLWNAIIVIIFGATLSGINLYEYIQNKFSISLHPIFSGALDTNDYGVEASYFLTVVIFIIFSYLYFTYKSNKK